MAAKTATRKRLDSLLKQHLIGRTIEDAFYADDGDQELFLDLDNGEVVTVMADAEGNDYGVLNVTIPETPLRSQRIPGKVGGW